MDTHRSERLAEALRGELEELINYEMADPRVSDVSVTEVLLSPDRKKGCVRLAIHGTEAEQAVTLAAIIRAKAFLWNRLRDRLALFHVPDLIYEAALAPGLGDKTAKLLKKIRKGRPRESTPPSPAGSPGETKK